MLPPAQSLNGTIDKLVKAWIFSAERAAQEFEFDEPVVNGLAESVGFRHGLRRWFAGRQFTRILKAQLELSNNRVQLLRAVAKPRAIQPGDSMHPAKVSS
ncbi:hypothetical protein DMW99_21475 [Pseudomonas chlororaphis]|nr:hypothetical protein C1Y36_29885 [Pseudomonas sp. FW306-2-2C-D06C]PYC33021.1 hypothetical protein DMW99_21475 [Pseudomonas chlororaphis]